MHPIARAFAAVALLRAAILVALHLQARHAGMPEPFPVLLTSLCVHVGATLLEGSVFLWAWAARPLRSVSALACAFAFGLCLWSVADPIVYLLAGDHLTPSLLAHFAGFKIFRSDYLWKPVQAYWPLVVAGMLGIAGLLWFFLRCERAGARQRRAISLRSCSAWTALGLGAVSLPAASGISSVDCPPELLFAVDAAGIRWSPAARDIAALRDFVGLPPGAHWLGDAYPLVYVPAARAPRRSGRPDIVLISIESLRGRDSRLFSGREDAHPLPQLEALAASAVVFPHFISNGFPSTEGFIATSASTWPHPRRRIVLELKSARLDLLASRLGSLGYRTLRVEDDPDFDEEGHWVRQSFGETLTFADRGRFPSERQMVREIRRWLDRHDRERAGEPVFLDWKTAHPHMPYEVPDDAIGQDRSFGSPRDNYARSLAYVDAAIGELIAQLRERRRWPDTLLFVLGDHSNWLVSTQTTALPSDEMVWTGALLAGAREWIGPARRDPAAASQVDVMPTLLALVGDDRPSAALGRDLLADPPGRPARAIAVRPGGLRLDEGGASLLVDRRHLHGGLRACAFGAAGACPGPRDGTPLARHVDTWGWLIEENRVFDPGLLAAPARAVRDERAQREPPIARRDPPVPDPN